MIRRNFIVSLAALFAAPKLIPSKFVKKEVPVLFASNFSAFRANVRAGDVIHAGDVVTATKNHLTGMWEVSPIYAGNTHVLMDVVEVESREAVVRFLDPEVYFNGISKKV